MFNHVMVGADDIDASKRFYDATLGALGMPPGVQDAKGRVIYRTDSGTLMLSKPLNGEAATGANGGTIGFKAGSAEQAEAWHAAGVSAGGTACEDPPGFRTDTVHLAYLRDPAGNKLCTVFRKPA